MKIWILYIASLVFAAYWASNLLLWYPWSYSPKLGMTLMLTVTPIIWAYITYLALRTYPKKELIKGALIVSMVFLLIAVIMDYIFFGLIRNALNELYHPTTFYGYGFLMVLPVLIVFTLKNKIAKQKREATNFNFMKTLSLGTFFLLVLTLIIVLDINI